MIVIRNNILPLKRFNAINLLGILFARKDAELDEYLLNHERIHTRQMLELLVVGFYLWYLVEWLIRLLMPGNAYLNISFEREAYANESKLNYLEHRKPYSWLRYIQKPYSVIHLLAIIFFMLMGCQDHQSAVISTTDAVTLQAQEQHENGSLRDSSVKNPAPQVALLQDTRVSFRLSNIRPQRLLPASSNGGGRIMARAPMSFISKHIINLHHDGRRRQESSPFRTFACSDYYVIALRRIIR